MLRVASREVTVGRCAQGDGSGKHRVSKGVTAIELAAFHLFLVTATQTPSRAAPDPSLCTVDCT